MEKGEFKFYFIINDINKHLLYTCYDQDNDRDNEHKKMKKMWSPFFKEF